MLQVSQLSRSFGAHDVFTGASFVLNQGERIGLIGPNGCGKSTLLRCIAGVERADRGSVALAPGASLGYLAQDPPFAASDSVQRALDRAQAELAAAELALQTAAEAMSGSPAALACYNDAVATFEAAGGYGRLSRADAVLNGLGLGALSPETPVATLSGGQKTRLALAMLLLREPDILLLDEPTNHLDVEALEWLERFVLTFRGAALVVSHDREFLDRTVTAVLVMDSHGSIRRYEGNYSAYAAARDAEAAARERSWKAQDAYVSRVRSDIARLKGEALDIELGSTPRQPGVRKFAKRKAAIAKAREHKLDRFLASDERVEKPRGEWSVNFGFGSTAPRGREVIRLRDVAARYGEGLPVFEGASFHVQHGDRLAVTGPNGAGKTTLLRIIDGRLAPSGGERQVSPSARVGTLTQEQETLDPRLTVLQTVRGVRLMGETEARGFLHLFLFAGDSVLRTVGLCSAGERTRLQLAVLVLQGCNVLILDEPLNHLDIDGREHFEQALAAFEGTVIAVAHDRRFLRSFARRVVEVRDGRVTLHEGAIP